MELAAYRKALGLTQMECARALGISSKGYISGIESGDRRASLKIALRIERWSNGKVRAASLNPDAAGFGKKKAA